MRRRRSNLEPTPAPAASPLEQHLADVIAARMLVGPVPVASLPVVAGLQALYCGQVGSFTLEAWRGPERWSTQPAILTQPDPDEPLGATLHKLTSSLFYTGNTWALVSWPPDGRPPANAIKVVDPRTVTPQMDPADPQRAAGWYIDGYRYDRSQVLHVKLLDDPRTGPLGTTPLELCQPALEAYCWAYRLFADAYAQGGVPSLVLKSKARLRKADADALWAEWVDARRQHRPAVMDGDVDLESGPTDTAAALVSVLDFAGAEVNRAFACPPSLLNAPSSSSLTYSTTVDELNRWLVLSLGPLFLSPLEAAFGGLLPRGTAARFNTMTLRRFEFAGAVPGQVAAPATPAAPMLEGVAGAPVG